MVKNYNEVLYANETIDCKDIILRRAKIEDAQMVLDKGTDEEVLRYIGWPGVQTIEEARQSIYDFFWSRPGIWAIEDKKSGRCMGDIIIILNHEHDRAMMAYSLAREFWGRGIMTQALAAVIDLCFEKLELNRVEAMYFVGNEGSGRVMEKNGMEREGLQRQGMKAKGVYHDTVMHGMTRDMWLERRGERGLEL